MPSQPSRSQRAATRTFRRNLAIGGGALLILVVIGLAIMATAKPSTLAGASSLPDRVAALDDPPHIHRLHGTGDLDVLIVGSSDCVHCAGFVEEGMDGFLQEATARDLDVGYVGIPSGPGSIVSARVLACFQGAPDPVGALRATYALSKAIVPQEDEATTLARLDRALADAGAGMDARTCWNRTATADPDRFAALSQALEMRGTPSFYVASQADPTDVRTFSGYAGRAGVVRQLSVARDR